jgi:hypothetical protein
MICFAKSGWHGLREDLYMFRKEEFLVTWYICDTYTLQRRRVFIWYKPILSSERMLHKDYVYNGSVEKNYLWSLALKDLAQRRTN